MASAGSAIQSLTRPETLALYRRLLRAGASFPSIRRDNILSDIRTQFREHQHETDHAKLAAALEEAHVALEQFDRFFPLTEAGEKQGSDAWHYEMKS